MGSVKWREQAQFDLHALVAQRTAVPGAEAAGLVGVSRSGFATDELDAALDPEDLIAAWQ